MRVDQIDADRCTAGYGLSSPMVSDDPRVWERSMVASIAAGDDSALAAVYDQYGPLVHGIAVRLVGSNTAADVSQEVFVALWEHPERFDAERGTLRTYLATIARCRSIDQLRRSGRRAANEQRSAQSAGTAVPNVEEAAMAMIAAERLRAAVERLPAEQRRAIELAYFEGLTFQQVAEATGAPEGTAKSRLRLALDRLTSAMRTDGAVEWA